MTGINWSNVISIGQYNKGDSDAMGNKAVMALYDLQQKGQIWSFVTEKLEWFVATGVTVVSGKKCEAFSLTPTYAECTKAI